MLTRKPSRLLAGLVLSAALALLGEGGWIQAKAQLAQWLLQSAWEETLRDGLRHRAWPSADHWPVARLRVAAHGIEEIVLEGDAGNVLAFAPGHNPQSAMPGNHGPVILSGHRDTHFSFLRGLETGERVELETVDGKTVYEVVGARVVDARSVRIDTLSRGDRLLLVTCYPFDALAPGGPLRYLVEAVAQSRI
jgi:sortase A